MGTPALMPHMTEEEEKDWRHFDSSYDRNEPTTFAPNQVIKGWTEAMQLMVEGDKWEMYIPSELGYGDAGTGADIRGGDVLVFRMEILKINGATLPADRCDPETGKGCTEKQKAYIEKQVQASAEKRKSELKRLQGMVGGEMKPDAKVWLTIRINLLNRMTEKNEL